VALQKGGESMAKALLRNLREAAGALRVSPSRVRLEVANGRLGHVRLGRRLLFREQDLREYVSLNVVPSTDHRERNGTT
jgi:excisionase family DNA binding protein